MKKVRHCALPFGYAGHKSDGEIVFLVLNIDQVCSRQMLRLIDRDHLITF